MKTNQILKALESLRDDSMSINSTDIHLLHDRQHAREYFGIKTTYVTGGVPEGYYLALYDDDTRQKSLVMRMMDMANNGEIGLEFDLVGMTTENQTIWLIALE